jgi:hypothetical protein
MEQGSNQTQSAGLMNKLKEGAVSQLNTQKDRATQGIGSVASAVRQSTQKLRDERHETIAQYVEQAATELDRFASNLKNKDAPALLDDAQRFARRNPAVFIGAAFAIGIAAARFLKSSGDGATDSRRGDYGDLHGGQYGSPRSAGAVGTSGSGYARPQVESIDVPVTSSAAVTPELDTRGGRQTLGGAAASPDSSSSRRRTSGSGTERS